MSAENAVDLMTAPLILKGTEAGGEGRRLASAFTSQNLLKKIPIVYLV